jgi:hypothetical protein
VPCFASQRITGMMVIATVEMVLLSKRPLLLSTNITSVP